MLGTTASPREASVFPNLGPSLLNMRQALLILPWWCTGCDSGFLLQGHRFDPWSGKFLMPCAEAKKKKKILITMRQILLNVSVCCLNLVEIS